MTFANYFTIGTSPFALYIDTNNSINYVLTVEVLDNRVTEQLDIDTQSLCESIENLLKSIQSSSISNNKKKLQADLNRLSSIYRHGQVSQAEIHQRLKFADNVTNIPFNTDCQEQILNLLLECSCVKYNDAQSVEMKIFTEEDIEQEYLHRSSPTIFCTRDN